MACKRVERLREQAFNFAAKSGGRHLQSAWARNMLAASNEGNSSTSPNGPQFRTMHIQVVDQHGNTVRGN